MDKMAGPVVGISVIAALAAGVYAYMLHGELQRARAALAAGRQTLEISRRTIEDANRKSAVARADLETCNALLKEMQAKAEAAQPRARKPRAPSPQPAQPSSPEGP
jgi:hypothetical protein